MSGKKGKNMSENQELIIFGNYNDTPIMARAKDLFIDVTALCQANGKRWNDYCNTEAAKRFRETVSARPRNPGSGAGSGDTDALVIVTRGEDGRQGHTFADRRIALHCASWISADFEVLVYERIEELLTKSFTTLNSGAVAPLSDTDTKLDTMLAMGQGLMQVVSAIAVGSNAGFRETFTRIAAMNQLLTERFTQMETRIVTAVEEAVTHPKAREPFGGPAPDELAYADIRSTMNDMATWFTTEFHTAPHHFYDGVYHMVAKILNFNVETHKTAYLKQLRVLLGDPGYSEKSVTKIEICDRFGIMRDVYRIAWELTLGGTASFPFPPYFVVDQEKYPVLLATRCAKQRRASRRRDRYHGNRLSLDREADARSFGVSSPAYASCRVLHRQAAEKVCSDCWC